MLSPMRFARRRRPGLTLVEILISTAVTLIMIYALVEIFERVGTAVGQGRATMEMSGQIRSAANRLREDLKGVTVPMRPWPHSASAEGYFEYLEGPRRDATFLTETPADSRIGDHDDVVMWTARSVEEPYVGRYFKFNATTNQNEVVAHESQMAEIVWWTKPDSTGSLSLHRRVLLVRPDLNPILNPNTVPPNQTPWDVSTNGGVDVFYDTYDVSVRQVGNTLVANTIADLTKRENRFAHYSITTFPFPLDVSTATNATSLYNLTQTGTQQGDDVILSHVRAFDVKAFDPLALIRTDGNRALVPSDPGWNQAPATTNAAIGMGTYVDLNYSNSLTLPDSFQTVFSGPAQWRSGMLVGIAPASVYCTWSFHYEHDGVNQDWPAPPPPPGPPPPPDPWGADLDQGTDGVDNNFVPNGPASHGPDDVLERETSPPYPVPLRGIAIKIRIDDDDSRQVREATVIHDFVPE